MLMLWIFFLICHHCCSRKCFWTGKCSFTFMHLNFLLVHILSTLKSCFYLSFLFRSHIQSLILEFLQLLVLWRGWSLLQRYEISLNICTLLTTAKFQLEGIRNCCRWLCCTISLSHGLRSRKKKRVCLMVIWFMERIDDDQWEYNLFCSLEVLYRLKKKIVVNYSSVLPKSRK